VSCVLCAPDLGPIVDESEHWRLVLNRNQNLLGKCFLVARRHREDVPELASGEWIDLRQQLARATEMLRLAFQPDHMNYAFLGNQDRHVHMHLIPRYAGSRRFGGEMFTDPDFPDHYAVPGPIRLLDPDLFAALAEQLRDHVPR